MCRTPLATAQHASIKNWNRISRPSLYFVLSPFTYQSVTWKRGLARKCAHFVVVLLKSVFSLISRVLLYCTTDFKCDRYPERRSGMSDAPFPAGISGLSFDSPGRSLQVILFPCTITWSATYIYVWSHDQQHNVGSHDQQHLYVWSHDQQQVPAGVFVVVVVKDLQWDWSSKWESHQLWRPKHA